MSKISFLCIFCLLFCLLAAGCGKDNVDTPSGDKIIYAPTESTVNSKTESTNDKADTASPDAEDSEFAEDTDTDAETSENTVPKVDTDLPFIPGTADNPETTQPDETDDVTNVPEDNTDTVVPEGTANVIEIGKALISGETITGKIYSGESEKIRLAVKYSCYANTTGGVSVDFEVGLECYNVNCGARIDTGKFTVNDTTYVFSTEPIAQETDTLAYIPFASYTYQSDMDDTACNVSASWLFNGVYGGTKIDTLTVDMVLDWSSLAVDVEA